MEIFHGFTETMDIFHDSMDFMDNIHESMETMEIFHRGENRAVGPNSIEFFRSLDKDETIIRRP
jgi:hypothetical protein